MDEQGDLAIRRSFFHPICSELEIDRVLDVKNADDYLLKLRAETIVDNMRLFRVYRNKARAMQGEWSLARSFDAAHYEQFLAKIPTSERQQCGPICFGDIFSNDPNGILMASEFGPVVTISTALDFFLKFAHLALLDFGVDVPAHVRMNGLRIAIRVMLKTEALDFLMDPRGILPRDVADAIHEPIERQKEFIAGHEFAHHILGHLDKTTIVQRHIFHAISERDQDNYGNVPTFTTSQQQELDADGAAVRLLGADGQHQRQVLEAALLWFACLELYEAAETSLYPSPPWRAGSHPTARSRFDSLRQLIASGQGSAKNFRQLLDAVDFWKDQVETDVARNPEAYEFYGSVYLDEPNTEWRGPELVDRRDYY